MPVKKIKYVKINRIRRKRTLVLSILFISLLMINFSKNLNINQNFNTLVNEYGKNEDFLGDKLKTKDLTSDNTFTGIGDPWNITHWANRTDFNLPVSFWNNTFDSAKIPIGSGWQGYQLKATISDLFDTRNWVNGTFHEGNDNGIGGTGENDSLYVLNWTWGYYDNDTHNNPMSGNYFNGSCGDPVEGEDYLELKIDSQTGTNYYEAGDRCWWISSFNVSRGKVIDGDIRISVYAYEYNDLSDFFSLQIFLNDKFIYSNGLYSISLLAGGSNWYDFIIPLDNFLDDSEIFSDPINDRKMNITIQLIALTDVCENVGPSMNTVQTLFFDNVSLNLKTEVKPEQIGLQLNKTNVADIDWGKGTKEIYGNWDGTVNPYVIANFTSTEVWPLGSYFIEFDTNLNLFTTKHYPETNFETNTASLGTKFSVVNDSFVNWEAYAYLGVPTRYEETLMKLAFPTDVNITFISEPQNPTVNILDQCDNSTKGILLVNVSTISVAPDGFWKLTALSPNYLKNLQIYNNKTGPWQESSEFLSGEYINITATVNNSNLISDHMTNTKAQLRIRFPNGSVWNEKMQLKSPDSNGFVQFDVFRIPDSPPNYEAGQYQAIVSWNNSYSNFGLNESGVRFKTFTVIHDSYLKADTNFFEDIIEGDTINIKVSFYDSKDLTAITDANVSVINFKGGRQQFSEIGPGYYFLEFNTTEGKPGNNSLNIIAKHPLYEDNQLTIKIELIVQTNLAANEYPSLKVAWNSNFTIHLNYTYASNGTGIKNAEFTIDWKGEKSSKSGNGLYNITLNSSLYEVNKIYNLKFTFDRTGCESQTLIISIEVVPRETYIDDIFINGADCTTNKSYNIRSGELLNITIKYKDNDTGGSLIHDATVTLNGTNIGEIFTDNNNFYNLTLNSTKLSVGISFLNIIAQKNNYTSITELLTINIYERGTNYWLYLNGTVQGKNPSIKLYKNQLLNITLTYNDTLLKKNIPDAIVDINGSGISELLTEAFNNYSVLINTNDLNQGVNFLTIFARKDGYEAQSILLIIEIIQIETNLTLFIDGEDITANPSITRYPNEMLNITVSYDKSVPVSHIPGAIVDINGSGISELFIEAFNNYSVLIDSGDLNQGVNFLTIFARKTGYEPQSISLVIEIIQIETDLTLFLNSVPKNDSATIQVEIDDTINIRVYYWDNITLEHIPNAIVNLLGVGILDEIGNYYTITINASDLTQTITVFTIFAQADHYDSQSIRFFVELVEKATTLQLFLNGVNKTLDPVFDLTIGQNLNITVKYTDQFGAFILNATVLLIGEDLLLDLMIDYTFQQYYIILNTNDLGIGVKLFSIITQKPYYQSITKDSRITVNRILAEIRTLSGEAQIEAEIGDNVLLQIILNDTIFGADISGATVTYKWAYGQGELLDSDNDGTFEIVLENVQEGIFTITINAFAEDKYDFESYEITLVVMRPEETVGPDLSWLIYVLGGGIVGIVSIFALYQKHFKYPPMVRKIRKLRKKIRKGKKVKPIMLNKREDIINENFKSQIQLMELKPIKSEKNFKVQIDSKIEKSDNLQNGGI